MSPKEYLNNKIKECSHYQLTDLDKKYLDTHDIVEYIFKVLTRKKFRKWKLAEETKTAIKETIQKNISQGAPIKFAFPFGGYKLWRIPGAPEVDWAEFFSIAYYVEYVSPLLPIYQPGVKFYFSSDDIIVEEMNNTPPEDTKKYFNSFNILLENFQKYFPGNLKMEIKRIADFYPDYEAFAKELADKIKITKEIYKTKNQDKIAKEIKTSELNIQWTGAADWTTLSDQEKKSKIEFGPILHDAYRSLKNRKSFIESDDTIKIFGNPISRAIALGTTKASITKFWTGFGVLEKKGDGFLERILSPKQLVQVKNMAHKTEKIDLVPLNNFKKILIFETAFNFTDHE